MQTTNWRITWGEHTWTDLDTTGAHIVAVADLVGQEGWEAINPWVGPKALAAWCVVLLSPTFEGDIEKALAEVYGASSEKLLGSLSTRD